MNNVGRHAFAARRAGSADVASDGVRRRLMRVFLPLSPLALCLWAILLLSLASLMLGAARLEGQAWFLLWVSRLPRTLAALLCGSALAVAGVIMQSLVRNRFVEPSTTGVSEGAMLGLIAVTLIAPGAPIVVKMLVAALWQRWPRSPGFWRCYGRCARVIRSWCR